MLLRIESSLLKLLNISFLLDTGFQVKISFSENGLGLRECDRVEVVGALVLTSFIP